MNERYLSFDYFIMTMPLSSYWEQYINAALKYERRELEPLEKIPKMVGSLERRALDEIGIFSRNVVDDEGNVIYISSRASHCHVGVIFRDHHEEILRPSEAFSNLDTIPDFFRTTDIVIERNTLFSMPEYLSRLRFTPFRYNREEVLAHYLKNLGEPEFIWALYLTNRDNLPRLKED